MEKITKICIFDMDGTMFKNPDKEECEKVWLEKFNKPWPYKGVYSKPESLDFNIFDIPTIEHIIDEYNKVKDDDTVYKVLLTGRLIRLEKEVKALLHFNDIFFDEYLLNNKGETLHFKLFELARLSTKFPNVNEITFFDDRDDHIPHFVALGKKIETDMLQLNKEVKFNMIHVKTNE